MTTNEMIYKTLTTKLTKEPIYKSILEDLGYVVFDSDCSAYSNWAIKNEKTSREIVISKDYDNKRGLFDPYNRIETKDIRKVDYVGFLNKKRAVFPYPNNSEYHEIRTTIQSENAYFAANNKEADIFDAVLTTNGITFDRFIDPLY